MLSVENLRAYYQMKYFGIDREVRAVDDITLDVKRNEIYGLAGESSSGKTSLHQDDRRRQPAAAQRRRRLGAVQLPRPRHPQPRAEEGSQAVRWKHLSYIMQGSMNVLNPVRRVKHSFFDFAFRHIGAAEARVPRHSSRRISRRLHLEPSVLDAYPHELSGGMRQRVTIALATICRPEFIIADEPTTALDVVVQKDVLAMIREVQREMGSSILFVTHDMAVHANMADRLGIMYAGPAGGGGADGRRSSRGRCHPYTAHLIAEPAADRRRRRRRRRSAARRRTCRRRRPAAASIRAARWPWTSAAARSRR